MEYLIIAVMLVCNLVIANEWAKYGLLQLGIQRPPNTKAWGSALIGMATYIGYALLQEHTEIEFTFLTEYNLVQASLILLGPPFAWLLLKRAILPAGLFAYNKAIIRTTYWAIQNYRPGKKMPEEAKSLRNFTKAQETIRLFQKAINQQKKGSTVSGGQKEIDLDEIETDYDNLVNTSCPGCGMPLKAPIYAPQGITGNCMYCGKMVTAKTIGNKLYLHCFGSRMRRMTDRNLQNIATAYEEMGWLLRMMHQFHEAQDALKKAEELADQLLEKEPENKEYLTLKSLIFFRQAELLHTQGKSPEVAKKLYQKSLDIDKLIGEYQDHDLVKGLMAELNA